MKKKSVFCFFLIAVIFVSCDAFLDVRMNSSEVTNETVFTDELNANAAVAGMYKTMTMSTLAGGGSDGVPALVGLSADELHNVLQDLSYVPFENNSLQSENDKVLRLWGSGYQIIYEANAIIENLDSYYSGSDSVRSTLRGEALFVRAYCYFYLTNLFGDIPLVVSTDYRKNSTLSRSSSEAVYDQITNDLLEAKMLLPSLYVGSERVRPNKYSASALLSRIYLYRKDWQAAESISSEIISSGFYSIEANLNAVFTKASNEVIWQLSSDFPFNTAEASNFVVLYGPGGATAAISEKLLESFEDGDLRMINWVGTYDDASLNIKFPYKYKVVDYGVDVAEHYVVLRLAEQFLIRAESRMMLGNYAGSIDDINAIRGRAGVDSLDNVPQLHGKDTLQSIILKERFLELFAEGGHRWLDLKRTGSAEVELKELKPSWVVADELYPIPQQERQKNPSLGDQNPGY